MAHLTNAEDLDCPRCGYDLRGSVAEWAERGACSLAGKCSECGLDFEWRLIFADSLHPWLFEFPSRQGRMVRFRETVLMSYRPWRFWREVALTDPVYRFRLCLMPLLLLGMLLVLRFMVGIWIYLDGIGQIRLWNWNALWRILEGFFARWLFWNQHLSWDWNRSWSRGYGSTVIPAFDWVVGALFLWSFLMVLSFGLLPVSVRRAKVSKRHLLRVSTYTFLPVLTYFLCWAVLDFTLLGLHEISGQRVLAMNILSGLGIVLFPALGWPCWSLYCWAIACQKYLKLPHSLVIAVMLNLASGLAVMLVTILYYNYLIARNL